MLFYNVVLPFGDSVEKFLDFCEKTKDNELIPRIPENILIDENQEEPRICLAPTVEDCLTAIGSKRLEIVFERYNNNLSGIPILIKEFANLDPKWLIKPTTEDVPDSEITNEHWYLETCKPSNVYVKWLIEYRDDATCSIVYPDWVVEACDIENLDISEFQEYAMHIQHIENLKLVELAELTAA